MFPWGQRMAQNTLAFQTVSIVETLFASKALPRLAVVPVSGMLPGSGNNMNPSIVCPVLGPTVMAFSKAGSAKLHASPRE